MPMFFLLPLLLCVHLGLSCRHPRCPSFWLHSILVDPNNYTVVAESKYFRDWACVKSLPGRCVRAYCLHASRVPVIAYSIKPELTHFNERGNWCEINVAIDTALYVYGCVPILGALCLSFQMRRVRKQMNFFRMQVCCVSFRRVRSIFGPVGWAIMPPAR